MKRKFVGQPKSALDFDWMKRAGKSLDALLNGQVVNGANGVVIYSDGNTIWQIPPGGVNLAITGEYDPNLTYSLNQVAIISMGSNAGTYVYINPSPSSGNAPYAGGGFWMQLPMGQLGVWL